MNLSAKITQKPLTADRIFKYMSNGIAGRGDGDGERGAGRGYYKDFYMRRVLVFVILILSFGAGVFAQSGITGTVSRVEDHGWPPPTRLALKRCIVRVTDSLTLETVAEGSINHTLGVNLRWEPNFSHQYHLDSYGCPNLVVDFSPRDFTVFPGQIRSIFISAWML